MQFGKIHHISSWTSKHDSDNSTLHHNGQKTKKTTALAVAKASKGVISSEITMKCKCVNEVLSSLFLDASACRKIDADWLIVVVGDHVIAHFSSDEI